MLTAVKDLGLTILVGALLLIAIEAIAWFVLGRALTGFFRGRIGLSSKAAPGHPADLAIWLFVLCSFVLGIICEDLSYAWRDPGVLPSIPTNVAGRKLALRQATIVSIESGLTPLGNELLERRAFALVGSAEHQRLFENGARVKQGFAFMADSSSRRDSAVHAIDRLYYTAKNWSYSKATSFQELEQLRSRIDFTRSNFLVLTACAFGATGCVLCVWVAGFRRSTLLPGRRVVTGAGLVALYSVVALLNYLAFKHESMEFNRRALGYFATSLLVVPNSALTKSETPE